MSNIKALDKLRELAADINSTEIIDHLDVIGKFMFHPEWLESWHEAFDAACYEIKREIAERYMELPVDADGVPIRLEDVVAVQDEQPFEVRAFQYDALGWFAIERLGSQWNVNQLHHVNQRTIEDAISDALRDYAITDMSRDEVIAKYAEEIRGMMA